MDYIKRYYLDNPHIKYSIEPKQRLSFNDWIDYVYAEVRGSNVSDEPMNTSENKAVLSPLSAESESEGQRGGGVDKSALKSPNLSKSK